MNGWATSISEFSILALTFLHRTSRGTGPVIAVLYQDTSKSRHLKTYELSVSDKVLKQGPISAREVEPGANILIPVPDGEASTPASHLQRSV